MDVDGPGDDGGLVMGSGVRRMVAGSMMMCVGWEDG